MDKKEIEKIILQSIGSPESGVLKENVSAMARALHDALNPKKEPEKETRVLDIPEIRETI